MEYLSPSAKCTLEQTDEDLTISPENPDPQSKSERVDKKILFSNISESRNSIVEDGQCPGLQGLIEINHDEYGTNKKEELSDVAERMQQNYNYFLMSSPEKIYYHKITSHKKLTLLNW